MRTQILKIFDKGYLIKYIKESKNEHESPLYHLVLKPFGHKNNILVVRDFAYYTQDYYQGTNPSNNQWFLQVIQYGSVGKENGRFIPGTPYLSQYHIEFIKEVVNGNYYNDFQFNFIEFKYGTTMKNIKKKLKDKIIY